MTYVKIEDVVVHLRTEIRKALSIAVNDMLPETEFDPDQLFRSFRRAVGRKCSTWERVPDHYVRVD